MSLFLDSYPLVVPKEAIREVGLNGAIVLQQVHYWCEINKRENRNFFDGRYWTYNTYDEWTEQFFWWSKSTIKRIIESLEKDGYLISGNYNKLKLDRTKWYAVNYDKFPSSQNETMQETSLNPAIPTINLPSNIVKELRVQNKVSHKQMLSSLYEDYGVERTNNMLDAVNKYIDVWYPAKTGVAHQHEGKYKRDVFALKLLRCSDMTDIDDETIAYALELAISNCPDDVDPLIYYATGDKVLGNALLQTGEIGYEEIAMTDYDINFG